MKCPACNHDNSSDSQFCGVCGSPLTASAPSGSGIGSVELPMVSFSDAVGRGFSNYLIFSGRATRAEYWWWQFFAALIGLIPFAFLVTLIPSLAVSVRRLHDINRTGWWLLLLLIPFLGWIVLVVWAIKRGDQ